MRNLINYSKFAQLPQEQQMQKLLQAINFALALPAMALDIAGNGVTRTCKSVNVLRARDAQVPELGAIKAFLARKYATPSDNPILTEAATRVQSYFHENLPEQDLGWVELYQLVDLRNSNQSEFDIVTTSAGVTFTQKKPGEKVKIRREISEDRTIVPYLTFADGIGILDDWLRFNKFWKVEDVVEEFIAQSWKNKADNHYALITALGAGINQAFDTDDTKTFNNAASAVIRALDAKGSTLGQGAQFDIVCAPENLGRVLKMLEATQGSLMIAYTASKEPLAYSVRRVVATPRIASSAGHYYLGIPGGKNKRGEWKDLTIETARDIYTRAEDWVGTLQYNAAIGDSDQWRRVAFA